MVDYNGREETFSPMSRKRQKSRPATEAYYEEEKEPMKHYREPDERRVKMDKKPDANKHEGKNVFGGGKKNCSPGQMYVPKKEHNESKFAGEQKQKKMY